MRAQNGKASEQKTKYEQFNFYMVMGRKEKETDSASKRAKIFVLDTNVLLHNYRAIYAFQENDIVIPITVLEELDKFKKGQDQINFNAREFVRELDKLSGGDLFSGGVPLGEGRGKIFIETGHGFSDKVREYFFEAIPDHRILSITQNVCEANPERKVALVTKDINLRMKAKALGLASEDFENDKVKNIDKLNKEVEEVENVDDVLLDKLKKDKKGMPLSNLSIDYQPHPHEYFILKGKGKNNLPVYFNPEKQLIELIKYQKITGIEPRNHEQAFAFHALMNPKIKLVGITGKAGTGKTLLALAAALEQHENYQQILLARPIVALADKDLGFLPGGEKDKIKPYMQPLFDNLTVIKGVFKHQGEVVHRIDSMQTTGQLEISPLAYIRGRTLSNVFFIIDEAQNLTPHEVKTIITRAGEGTKIVFTGDIQQIDSPYLDSMSNGLSHLTSKMKGQEIFAHINLTKGERSELAELASELL